MSDDRESRARKRNEKGIADRETKRQAGIELELHRQKQRGDELQQRVHVLDKRVHELQEILKVAEESQRRQTGIIMELEPLSDPFKFGAFCHAEMQAMAKNEQFQEAQNNINFTRALEYTHKKFLGSIVKHCPSIMSFLCGLVSPHS